MRIGLVIDRFRPLRGGAEQWTYQFTRHLLAEGHEVHVVAQDFAAETEQPAIIRHPVGRIRFTVRLAEAVERQLRTLALDVIHDMGTGWYGDIFEPHYGSRMRPVGPQAEPPAPLAAAVEAGGHPLPPALPPPARPDAAAIRRSAPDHHRPVEDGGRRLRTLPRRPPRADPPGLQRRRRGTVLARPPRRAPPLDPRPPRHRRLGRRLPLQRPRLRPQGTRGRHAGRGDPRPRGPPRPSIDPRGQTELALSAARPRTAAGRPGGVHRGRRGSDAVLRGGRRRGPADVLRPCAW